MTDLFFQEDQYFDQYIRNSKVIYIINLFNPKYQRFNLNNILNRLFLQQLNFSYYLHQYLIFFN
jgi:hypothetical protein